MKILVQNLLAAILVFTTIETKTTKKPNDDPVKTIQEIFEVEEPHVNTSPTPKQAPVYEHTSYVSYKIQDPGMVLGKNMLSLPPDFKNSEQTAENQQEMMTNSTDNSRENKTDCPESHSDSVMRATVSKELLTYLLGMLTKDDFDVIYSPGSKSRDFLPAEIIRKFMKKLLESLTPKQVRSINRKYRSNTDDSEESIENMSEEKPPMPYFIPPYIPQPLPMYDPYADFYRSARKIPYGPHGPFPFMSVMRPDITRLESWHSPDFQDMEEKFPSHRIQHQTYFSRSKMPKNTVKGEHISNVKFDKFMDDDDDFMDFF